MVTINDVEKEIESIETETCGELVPVIAKRSSDYRSVEIINAFIFAYLFMFIDFGVHGRLNPLNIMFDTVVAVLLIVLLFRFSFFKRILIPKKLMAHKVHTAAMMSFYRNGVHKTKDRTGILIYISLAERMVVVIGDEGIHNKVGNDAWNDVVSIIVNGIKTKKVEQGIIDGVESCRGLLKKHFPISAHDTNELSNKVVYE